MKITYIEKIIIENQITHFYFDQVLHAEPETHNKIQCFQHHGRYGPVYLFSRSVGELGPEGCCEFICMKERNAFFVSFVA